ncbi:MAG: sulfatase [Maioricimonas sp. JB049]
MRRIPFVLLTLTAFVLVGAAPARAAERPNILFIFTDDQAPWALGKSGDPNAHTPHLDRLFSEGAYLTNNFTVTPVCSPSRTSLISSRYGTEMGITDWIHPRNEPELGLDPSTPAWPRLLHDAGYQTALIGKWHLGTHDRYHPTQFGYDYFMGIREGGTSPVNPRLEVNGKMQTVRGFTPDILTDETIRWLRLRDPKQGPFAVSLHFRAPHARWLPVRDEDWSPFENLDPTIPNPDFPKLDTQRVQRMTREYLASTASVDRNVGKLLEELRVLGVDENTVVIFSSDHGYNMGHNGIWHKGNGHWVLTEPPAATENIPRNQRPNMYDHSIRVPTAVRWPGVTSPGTVVAETTSNLDWFPTLLEMAGVDLPEDVVVHGRSIVPLLKGQIPEDWNNDFYAEYSTHHQSRTHMRMYRTPTWKLVRDFLNPERDELYNLEDDPAEAHNLIDDESPRVQQVIAELHAKILQRMREIDDPVLETLEH